MLVTINHGRVNFSCIALLNWFSGQSKIAFLPQFHKVPSIMSAALCLSDSKFLINPTELSSVTLLDGMKVMSLVLVRQRDSSMFNGSFIPQWRREQSSFLSIVFIMSIGLLTPRELQSSTAV